MKKTQLIFAGIASLLFSNALFSQEKPKEWDVSLYGHSCKLRAPTPGGSKR